MNSPAYDIAQMISSISSMPAFGTGVYVGREPDTPDNTITVFDTGGFEPLVTSFYEKPTVQVRVRNKSYSIGYQLLDEIKQSLHGSYTNEEGGLIYAILVMADITGLGYDTNGRALLVLNFALERRLAN